MEPRTHEGDSSGICNGQPLDLAHLDRQTMGDGDLRREVLELFVDQCETVRDRIRDAGQRERASLAHALKGAAGGVGAFHLAACAAEIENCPADLRIVERLSALVEDVRNFVAAISR